MDFVFLALDQLGQPGSQNAIYVLAVERTSPLWFVCLADREPVQPAQHSQSLESMFMHFPGLKSCESLNRHTDAKGLLITAILRSEPGRLRRTQTAL